MSLEVNPEGAINSEQIQTPITQLLEISTLERRRMIFTINGMLKNGSTMAAKRLTILT